VQCMAKAKTCFPLKSLVDFIASNLTNFNSAFTLKRSFHRYSTTRRLRWDGLSTKLGSPTNASTEAVVAAVYCSTCSLGYRPYTDELVMKRNRLVTMCYVIDNSFGLKHSSCSFVQRPLWIIVDVLITSPEIQSFHSVTPVKCYLL